MSKKYLTEKQLAETTQRSIKSLQRDRISGGGIPFIRFGGKILYDPEDVDTHMKSNKFTSTSEYVEDPS